MASSNMPVQKFAFSGSGGGDSDAARRPRGGAPAMNGAAVGDEDEVDERVDLLARLPTEVRRRVAALRKLQIDSLHVEADFYKKVHELECQFTAHFNKLYSRRKELVTGQTEPTQDEADYKLFSESEADLAAKFAEVVQVKGNTEVNTGSTKGIPDFWLNVLKSVEVTADMIQECDDDVLKHLNDITIALSQNPMAFTIEFHFNPNPYFRNEKLTKVYYMKCEPDMKDPADFDGPEIVKCEGCAIDWMPDKNVTMKLVKKKQKNKKEGSTRFVTKKVKADSFFNYFDPPAHHGDDSDEQLDDGDRMLLHLDFEIGQTIRDTIVPHALFHYTGECDVDDDDDFDDEEVDDEDEDDDGEED